jgi:hypothetical protein
MKFHVATLTLGDLAIKFIMLIGISGPILIILIEKLEVPIERNLCVKPKIIVLFFKN